MGTWALLGGFLAMALAITLIALRLKARLRQLSQRIFGHGDVMQVLTQVRSGIEDRPRSLSAMDRLLLPGILRDFPDFDAELAKTYVRNYLKQTFSAKKDLTVYQIVISKYLTSGAQRTIVFQAALSFFEGSQKLQKRYDIHYGHILSGEAPSVAANCPNCGAALGFGETDCPYCGSRVANILGNTWHFTDLIET